MACRKLAFYFTGHQLSDLFTYFIAGGFLHEKFMKEPKDIQREYRERTKKRLADLAREQNTLKASFIIEKSRALNLDPLAVAATYKKLNRTSHVSLLDALPQIVETLRKECSPELIAEYL